MSTCEKCGATSVNNPLSGTNDHMRCMDAMACSSRSTIESERKEALAEWILSWSLTLPDEWYEAMCLLMAERASA